MESSLLFALAPSTLEIQQQAGGDQAQGEDCGGGRFWSGKGTPKDPRTSRADGTKGTPVSNIVVSISPVLFVFVVGGNVLVCASLW